MIEWRPATPRDRRALEAYTCADPEGGYYDRLLRQKKHREPWAEEVQKGLRNWRYRQADRELWLGLEGDELVSAGAYSGWLDDRDSDPSFLIEYVSCAFEWRRNGIGDLCLGQLLAVISDITGFREGVKLRAYVHEENEASRRLFDRFGFAHAGTFREPIREGSGLKRLGARYGVWHGQL